MNLTVPEYRRLTNSAWTIRRALAEKHDCRASEISWKASLLLALANEREGDAAAARAAAAELLPKTRWQDVALAVLETLRPTRAMFPIERIAGLAVVALTLIVIL